jgi:hypothetical protein
VNPLTFLFSTKCCPVFAFLPGIQSSKPSSTRLQCPYFGPISAAAPAFAGHFSSEICYRTAIVVTHVLRATRGPVLRPNITPVPPCYTFYVAPHSVPLQHPQCP